MPDTMFGTGTKEYGARDEQPDNSYVTTKFIVLLHIPLWPLESRRVRYDIDVRMGHRRVKRYVLKRLPVRWGQELKVLAVGWGVVLAFSVAVFGAIMYLF